MGNGTIHLYVFDGYCDWEPSYAISQLNHGLRLSTVAVALEPALTAGGLRIVPDITLDALFPADSALLILPDGAAWRTGGNREAIRKAKEFLDAGVPVGVLGQAAAGMARMGLERNANLIAANGAGPEEFAHRIAGVLGPALAIEPHRPGPLTPENALRPMVWSDPAGIADSPACRRTIISIHLGASVHVGCRRGGKYHCGLNVHGDIDIIPPGTPSRWELRENDTSFVIHVANRLMNVVASESGLDPARVEILNRFQMRDPQIEHLGWALKAEMDGGYRSGRLYLDSLGTAIAACVLDRHSSVSRARHLLSQGMSGHRLRQVLSYIEYNLGRELSLKEIAGVAGVSVSHCNTAFRKAVGMPVHQYVIERRVEQAKTLLAEGHLSISQIAVETGFSHQSHLAYHVRRLLGVSPLNLRRRTASKFTTAG